MVIILISITDWLLMFDHKLVYLDKLVSVQKGSNATKNTSSVCNQPGLKLTILLL